MTIDEFCKIALSFPNTTSAPHFDRTAFKVIGRKIFATLHEESQTANLMLSVEDQREFCALDGASAYPVNNKWGEKGVTTFALQNADKVIIYNALELAYTYAAKPKVKKKINYSNK